MHWTNSDEIPNMLSTSQVVIDMFSRTGFSVRSHFQLVCLLMDSLEIRMFNRSHNNFEFGTLLKRLCYAHIHSSNAIFNILKSCVAFFHQFHATLDADMLLYQVCHFEGSPELQMEQHTLASTMTLLNSHTNHMLIPSWTWHCEFHSISNERSLYHQQWCYLKVSPENNHTTFLDTIMCCEFTLHYFRMFCVWVNTQGGPKVTRNVEQRWLVPSPWQCPCPHSLECAAVFGKKQHDGYPSSSLFTRPCTMRLFPVPSYEMPDERERFCWCQWSEEENAGGLNNIRTEEFQKCFQQWEKHWYKCIKSKGEYFEGD